VKSLHQVVLHVRLQGTQLACSMLLRNTPAAVRGTTTACQPRHNRTKQQQQQQQQQSAPATPPPMMSTLAGGTRPAAVICPVKKRPKCCAASTTALRGEAGRWRGVHECAGHRSKQQVSENKLSLFHAMRSSLSASPVASDVGH